MKAINLTAAIMTALTLLASCQKTEFRTSDSGKLLTINPTTCTVETKAPIAGTTFPTDRDIVLAAVSNTASDTSILFTGETFTHNNGVWSADKTWPEAGTVDLLAYSIDSDVIPVYDSKASEGVTLSLTNNQCDILWAAAKNQSEQTTGGTVALDFRHAASALAFTAKCDVAYNSTSNKGITITDITVNGVAQSADVKLNGDLTCAWSNISDEDDITLPGIPSGYNVPAAATAESFGIGSTGLIVFPQTATSFTVTYTLHNGRDTGGNAIDIENRTFTYNCEDSWDSGTKYTYALNFSYKLQSMSVSTSMEEWTDNVTDVNIDPYPEINALCFSAQAKQTISLKNSDNAPVLQFSYDKTTWNAWDYSALTFGTTEHPSVYIRGKNTLGFSLNYNKFSIFTLGNSTPVNCHGNIMSLLDWEDNNLKTIPNAYCYSNMFYLCTSLTTAPELPATELAESCYSNMFEGCTSLTTAPELPATELAESCYSNMFKSCTSLNSVTMKATDVTAVDCLTGWLNKAGIDAVSPTLYVDPSMVSNSTITNNKDVFTVTAIP